jgi:ABC-type antimicrobial peptide transport system permease subunit
MSKKDIFSMSFRNLWRRKTRTFLTMLGVVIGTASIVVMMSLGIAMDVNFQQQLEQMGELNIIQVYNYGGSRQPVAVGAGGERAQEPLKLDDRAVASFAAMAGVEAVLPTRSVYVKMVLGNMVGSVDVMGIDPAIQEAFDFEAEKGRLLLGGDKEAILFGNMIPSWFYNPRTYYYDEAATVELVTDRLEVTSDFSYGERQYDNGQSDDRVEYKVFEARGIGVLALSNDFKDYTSFAPLEFVDTLIKERDAAENNRVNPADLEYNGVRVKVAELEHVEAVNDAIRELGYSTFSFIELSKDMKRTAGLIQAVLGGLGAVSLLVAAIGIANTMVMSIYERTREIGVMKVLGAYLQDIRSLFLLEAGLIGLGGGILGLLFSFGISTALNTFGVEFISRFLGGYGFSKISVITWQWSALAIAFSTVVGILAGYSPARRAMRLSALEAIKNE